MVIRPDEVASGSGAAPGLTAQRSAVEKTPVVGAQMQIERLQNDLHMMRRALRANFDQVQEHNETMANDMRQQQLEISRLTAYKERASAHLQAQVQRCGGITTSTLTSSSHVHLCQPLLCRST